MWNGKGREGWRVGDEVRDREEGRGRGRDETKT